jgi:hypothetical protein
VSSQSGDDAQIANSPLLQTLGKLYFPRSAALFKCFDDSGWGSFALAE